MNTFFKAIITSAALMAASPIALAQNLSPQASLALEELGLHSEGILQYSDAVETDGTVVLKELTDSDGLVFIQELVISNLEMTDDGPSATDMILVDLRMGDLEDDLFGVKIETMSVTDVDSAIGLLQYNIENPPSEEELITFPPDWAFGEIAIGGLTIQSTIPDAEFDMAIGEFLLRDVTDEALGAFDVKDMRLNMLFDGISATASLKAITVAGLNQYGREAFELGWIESEPDRNEARVALLRDRQAAALIEQGYDSILVDDMRISVDGMNLALPTLTGRVVRDDNGVAKEVFYDRFDLSLTSEFEGDIGLQLSGILALLGVSDGLVMSGESYVSYDDVTGEATVPLDRNFIEFKDLVRLDMGYQFANAQDLYRVLLDLGDEFNPSVDEDFLAVALEKFSLADFALDISDYGLVDGLLAAFALQSGTDPETARQQASGALLIGSAAIPAEFLNPAVKSELISAMASFLGGNKKMTIRFDPETSIKGTDFLTFGALDKAQLGFEATTK